jgi:Tol biopolymer transport system component
VRHTRALLPYVAAAAIIAAGSVALVFATVGASEDPAPASSVGTGAGQQLSSSGRLAYWRQSPSGAFVLWAANLDGSRPRSLTTLVANTSRPFGTRWTGDGNAVAFVTDVGIAVVKLDGTRIDISVPTQPRLSGFRVIDQRWSPSGMRVAATLQRSTDGKTDLYLGSVERRELVRAGELGNAFAGDWLSDDEVLVESDTGTLGVLAQPGQPIRKLVERSGASPFFDGTRVLFLAGAVAATGDASGIFVTDPSVWSVRPDGTDLRPGGRLEVAGSFRLDGVWPDGRYLMHVGRDQTQYLIGPRSTSLAASSLLRRAVVSSDRRTAIGFGGSRIVRIDLSRGLSPTESAFVVLLDGVLSADAWVRRSALP